MNKYLFIGLDYQHCENRSIDAVINIYKITEYLNKKYNVIIDPDDIITDNKDKSKATRQNILMRLYRLGLETWSQNLKNVFIYYAGDSIDTLEYIYANNNIIKEGIVPSDYKTSGIISKEELMQIINQFNPATQIIFIGDCCFPSSNIFDLKYTWDVKNDSYSITNQSTRRKIMTLTYTINKYSHRTDDNLFNVLNFNEKIYSIADYIAKLDDRNNSMFELLQDIHHIFERKNINMIPTLSLSYLPDNNDKIFKFMEPTKIEASSFEEYKRQSYIPQMHFRPIQNNIEDMYLYIEQQPIYHIHECYC